MDETSCLAVVPSGEPAICKRDQLTLWSLRILSFRDHLSAYLAESGRGRPSALVALGLSEECDGPRSTGQVRARLDERLLDLSGGAVDRSEPLIHNAELLAGTLNLGRTDTELLALLLCGEVERDLSACLCSLLRFVGRAKSQVSLALAFVLDVPVAEVDEALSPEGALFRARLMAYDETGLKLKAGDSPFDVSMTAQRALASAAADEQVLLHRFVMPGPPPELTLTDFAHLGADLDLLHSFLVGALRQGTVGVNILLHGAPGTGKTQLARVLGASAGTGAYEVSHLDRHGNEGQRYDRLRHLRLCEALLQRPGGAVVIFDEAEDVFPVPPPMGTSSCAAKLWQNRQLEENPVPVIWTANEIDHMDPAVLRRFDVVLAVRRPPPAVLRHVFANALADLPCDPRSLGRLANDERLVQADVTRAGRVARVARAGGGVEPDKTVQRVIDLSLTARFGRRGMAYPFDRERYDPALLCTSVDLDALVATLRRHPRGSVCLHGAPGTGKTAFVHHVADQLELPLLHRRASELLSKFVGDTEKILAATFEEALDSGAVLLLDEADSFLRDRSTATHSWEVSHVNELLVQMEAFDGLFFCATNLFDTLDQAAFRRFGLKVRFDPLAEPQRRVLFERTLRELAGDAAWTPPRSPCDPVAELAGLTPGDFKAVRERFRILGLRPTAEDLALALREELDVRGPTPARTAMGFR